MQITELLKQAVLQRASDVHLVPGAPPLLRIDGQLLPVPQHPPLGGKDTENFLLPILTELQRARLGQEYCVDFSMNIDDTRYRGNALFQRNGLEIIFRLVPKLIPTPESLLLPSVVTDLANLRSGLVLVTGPTGTGKSTTLACLIDLVNQRRRGNIITIEDPIEFVHSNKNCIVSQREINIHSSSFSSALRFVMRQDPDVVMVGEMRDLETISAAITVAETGHLVLATLHSTNAAQAVDRIIDVFPAQQQQQIRVQLSGVLRGVIAQSLAPRSKGRGRVAIREIMIVNAAISNLIRTGRTHEIHSAIEMGAREGMVSLSRALAELQKGGMIDSQEVNSRQQGIHSSGPKRSGSDSSAPPMAA